MLFQTTSGLTEGCGESPGLVCDWVFDLTDNSSVARIVDWVVAKPMKVLLIFLLAWIIVRILRRSITHFVDKLVQERQEAAEQRRVEEVDDGRFAAAERALRKANLLAVQAERSTQRAQALGSVLRSLASLVVYGLAVFIALAEFGINLGPLIAGAGVVGIALGFGAQTLVRDFLSGMFMLVEDQYGIGDIVDLGEASGVVEEVRLRTTRLRDVNGTVWFVPNGVIQRVGNKSQQWARAVLDIEVAYDTDIQHAAAVIKQVADSVWQDELEFATVLEEPEIWGIEAFGASSIAIRLVVKVEPGEQWATAREIRKRIKTAFDAEGIEIPFPQRTVWMHNVVDAGQPPRPVRDDEEDFLASGAPEEDGDE
jgi:small conductance mechanosensitive channel